MAEFWQTRAGRVFYEVTMPALVKEVGRLNATLERIAVSLEADGRRLNGKSDGREDLPKSVKRANAREEGT